VSRRPTVRARLAARLAGAGYPLDVGPTGAQGYYRISKRLDDTTTCWDGYVRRGIRWLHVVSYDTMSDCVRYGFDTAEVDSLVWVYARKPKS
jgi:hypothetical protein